MDSTAPDDPRPDLPDGDPVEHLWNAAHEMLRAFRTLIDAADEFVESQRGTHPGPSRTYEGRPGRVHHITIDDDLDDRDLDDRDLDDRDLDDRDLDDRHGRGAG